ncbi:MAG: SxtJ family membrane protein [Burkholderiales bacterium]
MAEGTATPKQLRNFALVTGGLIAAIFGLLLPWIWGFAWPVWPWATGGVLALWGLVAPRTLGPLYHYWMKFAEIIGRFNTQILLGFVFYAMITPIGFLLRLFVRDPMARKFDPQASSYRVPPGSANDMEAPY